MKTGPYKWTDEKVLQGLKRFHIENNRYPSAREFDRCSYLPNARTIQKYYPGGLPEFRRKFIPDAPLDLTKGLTRSVIAKNSIRRSYEYEERFYNLLCKKIPEYLVHEQKRLRPGNIACDFFIYTSETAGIALDLFYAAELFNLIGVINIKLKRYSQLLENQEIFFVCVTDMDFGQKDINKWIGRRKNILPRNIHILMEKEFLNTVDTLITDVAL